jgi:hypothetical protein
MPRVLADETEEQVWLTVSNVLLDPTLIKDQLTKVGDPESRTALEDEKLRLEALIRDIKRRQLRLLRELEDEDMPSGIIKERIKSNEAECKMLGEQVLRVARTLSDQAGSLRSLKDLENYIGRVGARLGEFGFDDKRLALEALGINVTAEEEELTIRGSIPLEDHDVVVSTVSRESRWTPPHLRDPRFRPSRRSKRRWDG